MADHPLINKLRLQPGQRAAFVNPPPGYVESLMLPETITTTDRLDSPCDFVQVFVHDSGEMARLIPAAIAAVKRDGLLWICYPKLSSGIESDLTRDDGWLVVEDAGWRGVAQVSIDATWSALRFRPRPYQSDEEAHAAQYAGSKAALLPIYERVRSVINGFGEDIEPAVRKSYVAFVRGKQFAVIQPTTNRRVDVGLKLPGVKATGRLETVVNVGSGSMTHKVALTSPDDLDDELAGWLRAAYERSRG